MLRYFCGSCNAILTFIILLMKTELWVLVFLFPLFSLFIGGHMFVFLQMILQTAFYLNNHIQSINLRFNKGSSGCLISVVSAHWIVFVLKIALNNASELCRNMTLLLSNVWSCESSAFSKPSNGDLVKFFMNTLYSVLQKNIGSAWYSC